MAALRTTTLVSIAALVALTTIPSATAETTTSTTCYGGQTASSVTFHSKRLMDTELVDVTMHISTGQLDMWQESNGVWGLQRTAKFCSERTIDEHGVVIDSRSWVEYPADVPMSA